MTSRCSRSMRRAVTSSESAPTRASDLASATARRLRTTVLRSVGMPLGVSHDRVVTCTNTGIVTSHEVDGRLVWSSGPVAGDRTMPAGPAPAGPSQRRRASGWPPGLRPRLPAGPQAGQAPAVREPVPLGSAQDLVGATSERLLLSVGMVLGSGCSRSRREAA